MDNHADTTCFGANFTPIYFTGQTCNVSPFSSEYHALENVQVCTAATAWDDPTTGQAHIIEVNQGLWFGNRMEHSLLSPNQCRWHGIEICDDPFDPNRPLRILDHTSETGIPLEYSKNVVFVKTRAPTNDEINNTDLPRIVLTSDQPWDPTSLGSAPGSQEVEEYRDGRFVSASYRHGGDNISNIYLWSCSPVYDEKTAATALVAATLTTQRHTTITPEELAKKFGCGLETAKKTLKATTQMGIRHAVHPLSRRYRTDIMQSRLRRLNTSFYSDTFFATTKSLSGKTCGQLFTNGRYTHVEPMTRKSEAGATLGNFLHEVGVPNNMIFDGALEQTGPRSEFMKRIRAQHINWRVTEPYAHWQNRAEGEIRELRKSWRLMRQRRNIPRRLWDYGIIHLAKIRTLTARGDAGRTPYEEITGETPDISEYVDFQFYDWVWYWDLPGDMDNPKIGRWLGVSHRIGSSMCYYVLTRTGQVISRSTCQHVTREELLTDDVKTRTATINDEINGRLADANHVIIHQDDNRFFIEDRGDPDDEEEAEVIALAEDPQIPEADEFTPDTYDEYIGSQILLPGKDGQIMGKVTKRLRGPDGNPIGRRNTNYLLDTRKYEVELSDGTTGEYFANVIAENLFAQVDAEGRQYMILDEITDHRKDATAIEKDDGWITLRSGRKARKTTTKGWKLQVSWKNGTSDWIPLKDLKESNPVEVAEYAKANKIDEEPAFAWWVHHILRRRNRIVSKVKARYWRTTHKFGIEIPHTVEEAYALDKKNGNDLWTRAIEKEMTKIRNMNAFEQFLKGSPDEVRSGKVKLPGYQEIKCHMIFDVKMDGKFTRKARFVANGNTTMDVAKWNTYASVVTRESVRIAFLYAALNDLDILGCDVSNAYLNAPCRERIWIQAGKEFGSEEGMVLIIKKALYGLKSSGFSWRTLMSQTLKDMGYKASVADPDVYMRRSSKPNGFQYYELLLTYVDDCLCVSAKPQETMDVLGKIFDLKDTVKKPDRYLGANILEYQLPDGRSAWAMSGKDYIANAVRIVKNMLAEDGQQLVSGWHSQRPMPKSYRPELDTTPLLSEELASRYHQLIGILRWGVELGRVDILLEVSLLSSHLCLPREGHLKAIYNIFAYLEKHLDAPLVFDDKEPEIREEAFQKVDWSESIYGKVEEEVPVNAPEPLGHPVVMTCFVDANHAGDMVTRRSQTGFIIYLNNAPIDWYSKRQNTVESSTFGSEFVAMRTAVERIKALRYKLRMFGIPIQGATNVLGDNESVVNSASKVEARLNKKHNAICFHTVREAAAAGWIRVGWEPTGTNVADIFTKMLEGNQRRKLLRAIFVRGTG